jgi:hypothetical protein
MQSTTGSKRRASSPLAREEVPKKQKTTVTSPITTAADVVELESPKTAKSDGVTDVNNVVADDTKTDNATDVDNMDVDATKRQSNTAAEAATPARKTKLPPIKDCFFPWKPTVVLPPHSQFWGIKPKTGDARPHADQPSARETNGATNPPMWEDRKYRFKRGSRYTKYFGPIEPEDAANGPDLDQEDLLVMHLIDMRPKSKKDPTPRRAPTFYVFEHGKPKDWNNMQAIKCLSDRRNQAIQRVTQDAPWSLIERQYLSQIINERPDASIWEWTELHNDRFMDEDFATSTGFSFTEKSEGRTCESVRAEYVTYKLAYDNGAPPENIRWCSDKSLAGKAIAAAGKFEAAFGLPDKKLEKEWDDTHDSDDDEDVPDQDQVVDGTPKPSKKKVKTPAKKSTPKKRAAKKSKAVISGSDTEGKLQAEASARMAEQPKLGDLEESLLELAGVYNPEEIRTFPPHSLPPNSSPSKIWGADSPLTELSSGPPSPTPEREFVALTVKKPDSSKAQLRPSTSSSFDLMGPDSPLTNLGSGPPSPGESHPSSSNAEDDAAAASAIGELVGGYVEKLINQAVAHAEQQKIAQSQIQDSVPAPEVTTSTVESEVQLQVELEVAETATTAASASPRASFRAARSIILDENYDDEEL